MTSKYGKEKVRCPYCGYRMPLLFNSRTKCSDLYVKCKNRDCKRMFEVNINSSSSVDK